MMEYVGASQWMREVHVALHDDDGEKQEFLWTLPLRGIFKRSATENADVVVVSIVHDEHNRHLMWFAFRSLRVLHVSRKHVLETGLRSFFT